MASTLPTATRCCSDCTDPVSVAVPGDPGAAGAAGADGADGANAYSTTAAGFTMPAEGGTVSVTVDTSAWAAPGQVVYVQNAGYFAVGGKDATHLTLLNLEDTGSGAYADNVAPGTVVALGQTVSPAGPQGPAGTLPGAAVLASNNLSDLTNFPDARTHLGLGTAAVKAAGKANGNVALVDDASDLTAGEVVVATANGIESQSAATARTTLGLSSAATKTTGVSSGNVAVNDGALSANLLVMATASGLQTPAVATARSAIGKVLPRYGLLGSVSAVNMNSALSDNAVAMESSRYVVDKVMVENASISLTTATAGVFTASSGGGTAVASDQALSALTATTKFKNLTLAATPGTDVLTSSTLYFRVGTAQGAAATANVWVWGWRLD